MATREFQALSVQFDVATKATIEATRLALVTAAKEANAKVQNTDPAPTLTIRHVDGVQGALEETVRSGGVIVYDYPRFDLVADFALETLKSLSPVSKGDYIQAHQLYLDGEPVSNLSTWRAGAQVLITNTVPYSRKIEIGAMKMRVPGTDHVYQQASVLVRRKYGDIIGIRFTFIGVEDGIIVRGKRGNRSSIRYPALIFSQH